MNNKLMIQPKDIYRKLAALLANIEGGKTKDHFLFSVLRKMDNSLAGDLHTSNGRLFAEDRGQFFLAEYPDSQELTTLKTSIALDGETAKRVIKNGSYIFNNQVPGANIRLGVHIESAISAAFIVHNPENRWIFMFTLTEG
ncbi:MAG: hypothetical protein P8X42_03805 [Calditrichaceae bacterium]|jgi:hypothetical protein